MLTDLCHCCGRYRVETALLDQLDGRGARPLWRLRHDGFIIEEYGQPDLLRDKLDELGILIEFPDGCE